MDLWVRNNAIYGIVFAYQHVQRIFTFMDVPLLKGKGCQMHPPQKKTLKKQEDLLFEQREIHIKFCEEGEKCCLNHKRGL